MSIVYVLTEYFEHEGRALLGVYGTEDGAREAAQRELAQPYGGDAYVVDEVTVDTNTTREVEWMNRQ